MVNYMHLLKIKIEEYALKYYKKHFIKAKTVVEHSTRGKKLRTKYINLPVIASMHNTHIQIKNNDDASPIILSKKILE